MILATRRGDHEVRDLFQGADRIPIPGTAGGIWASAGRWVSTEDAVGLPAVMAAIRALAETAGSLPMMVYRENADGHERAPDASQWTLLHDKPAEGVTPFNLYSYVVSCLQGWGNAFVLKQRARGKIVQLMPVDPRRVRICVGAGGTMTFEIRDGNTTTTLSRSDILHIPGVLFDSQLVGSSPLAIHRESIGTALAREEYGGRFFANDATPGGVLQIPGDATKQQRDEMREAWQSQHQGGEKSHKLGVLIGGTTYQKVGVSPQDAQYVEGQRFSVEEVSRIFRVPTWMLAGLDQEARATQEQKNMVFLQYGLAPWLVRVEQALHADDDLFPDKTLHPEFLADGLLRADTATRNAAYVQGRQAGWLTVNEIRAMENRPPIEGGDVIQQTPVGGAPNLQPTQPAVEPDSAVPAT